MSSCAGAVTLLWASSKHGSKDESANIADLTAFRGHPNKHSRIKQHVGLMKGPDSTCKLQCNADSRTGQAAQLERS